MQVILIDDSVVIHYPYPLKPQKSRKGKKRERQAWNHEEAVHTTKNGVGVVGALMKRKKRHAL